MARDSGERDESRLSLTQQRKKEHLELCLGGDSQSRAGPMGFAALTFLHVALPEIDFAELDTSTCFMGKTLSAPILLSSMTGGFDEAGAINRNLAQAAQELGLGMGVGSQRVLLESPEVAASFRVRDLAPDILLLGNLGAVQLNYGYTIEQCRRAVEMIRADGLALHLNVLQELTQPEGNRNFKGLGAKIATVCQGLDVPVLVKEVGNGISGSVALRLKEAGVKAIDVAGVGGTSWYAVETKRAPASELPSQHAFADWGIPTEQALMMVRKAVPDLELVASGGMRTGLDIAKSIALGANVAAIGQPLLAPALESVGAVVKFLSRIIHDIKVAMMCVGARTLPELRRVPLYRMTAEGLKRIGG